MTQIPLPKIESPERTPTYGRFVIEPLKKGWRITIGNAIRRVLLNSLTGAAATWIKVEGIQHEFTSIPNVKEDAIDVILNIKEMRLRALSQRPGKLFLDVEREGEVRAADITPSVDFQVINPELHLASLDSPEAKLHVEFNVELGTGYVPATSSSGLAAGTIPIDAIFTPIRKVNFSVEPTRPGEESTQERLVLDIWTDGTLTPDEAVSQSAAILVEQLSVFRQLVKMPEEQEGVKTYLRQVVPPDKYGMSLEQLNLSTRT